MSIIDELIEEGKAIGVPLGIYMEKKRLVIVFYKKRYTRKLITECVELPIEEVKKIIVEYRKQQQESN